MKRLNRAMRMPRVGGRPLPQVFQSLPAIRRSETTVIAGESNAGKSLLALWQVVKWVTVHRLRGIYFSADGSELEQGSRALAMLSDNLSAAEAERVLESKDEYALSMMEKVAGLMWSFDADLTYKTIHEEVLAFIELWGCAPDFIVIDNLTDVEGQEDDEWGTKRRVQKALVQLARNTDAAVIILDHCGDGAKGNPCPAKSEVLGRASAKPRMIWTTADRGTKRPVAVVKDSHNSGADKSGSSATWLTLNQQTLHFSEY